MKYQDLRRVVEKAVAIRVKDELQPAAGKGAPILAATYKGGFNTFDAYSTKNSCIVKGVCVDSVQSQANRMEKSLQEAYDSDLIDMPLVALDCSELDTTFNELTTLETPQRLADSYFRDSQLDGEVFHETPMGKEFEDSHTKNATGTFKYCPHGQVFGMWNSFGSTKSKNYSYERIISSDVRGFGVTVVEEKDSVVRKDPVNFSSSVLLTCEGSPVTWKIAPKDAKKGAKKDAKKGAKKDTKKVEIVKPSDMGLGSILGSGVKRVFADYYEYRSTISLGRLRQLKYPIKGKTSDAVDTAARTVIAALSLLAIVLRDRDYAFRTECTLVPTTPEFVFEVVAKDGTSNSFELSKCQALLLFEEASKEAKKVGLPWNTKKIVLKPQPKLVELAAKSRVYQDKE